MCVCDSFILLFVPTSSIEYIILCMCVNRIKSRCAPELNIAERSLRLVMFFFVVQFPGRICACHAQIPKSPPQLPE